ncbi:hypothetical protein AN4845.2 [Aspergillus nidulans FGSC A4]|uniref:GPI anchored protein, putative (AFU_orthologue AFUA_5G09960) n=1 Tax=Emericella nidulans (strain FGSC A4 / ATCC 38163 / CBS 112.46 / NRRL 194 / M139) TaxID=227321 RepID=Q5B3N5_EMENI|nr:hypothetical protein [Aspergillus nidulans FGSC A4]EAA60080.1 hypothetical protein AN4845.2 [Aspergillus nidulans FGSC A4]CBF76646.1 TPA: GPI anchored protein, putative (AFU_orthologue; AFUA_5G09960) [Aspergillus nidulans FGSC A4]|eukprot:XP_662449.1 hypothetical protein AN4845.2 [Aspergillus nidulans FGSC A4]
MTSLRGRWPLLFLFCISLFTLCDASSPKRRSLFQPIQSKPRQKTSELRGNSSIADIAARDIFDPFSTSLEKRQYTCPSGYSLCTTSRRCCPSPADACCSDGTCVIRGTEECCLTGGACPEGQSCCRDGCIPADGKCCSVGDGYCEADEKCCSNGVTCAPLDGECCNVRGYCPRGQRCVVLNGERGCCPLSGCYSTDYDSDDDDDDDDEETSITTSSSSSSVTTYTQIIYWYYWVYWYIEVWWYIEIDIQTSTLSLTSSSTRTSSTATVSASNSAAASSIFEGISESVSASATTTPDLDDVPTRTTTTTTAGPTSTDDADSDSGPVVTGGSGPTGDSSGGVNETSVPNVDKAASLSSEGMWATGVLIPKHRLAPKYNALRPLYSVHTQITAHPVNSFRPRYTANRELC